MQSYGYLALWVSVFVAAIGLPLPIALVLLASGAFAALGDFNIFLLAIISISASVAGDNVGYLVGRKWGSKALDWLGQSRFGRRLFSPRAITRSRDQFKRHGGWAVFLTRFLIASLGGVTNLVAGAELFPYRIFLICDILGEVLGAVLPLSLGYIFATSWEEVGDVLSTFSFLLLALLIAILLFVRLLHYARSVKRADATQDTLKNAIASHTSHTTINSMIDPSAPSSGPLS